MNTTLREIDLASRDGLTVVADGSLTIPLAVTATAVAALIAVSPPTHLPPSTGCCDLAELTPSGRGVDLATSLPHYPRPSSGSDVSPGQILITTFGVVIGGRETPHPMDIIRISAKTFINACIFNITTG